MPKRSDEFQQLIALIQLAVAEDGFTVTEPAEVEDSHGKKHEVDVLVEGAAAGHPVGIAIECRDRSRPADQEWIQQIAGKYDFVPTIHLHIAVSRSGFTKGALREAQLRGIRTLTLEEATDTDWRSEIREVVALGYWTTITDVTVWWPDDPGDTFCQAIPDSLYESTLVAESGERIASIGEICDEFLRSSELAVRQLRATDAGFIRFHDQAAIEFPPTSYHELPDGQRHQVAALQLAYASERVARATTTEIKQARFADRNVVHGSLDLGTTQAKFVIAGNEDELVLATETVDNAGARHRIRLSTSDPVTPSGRGIERWSTVEWYEQTREEVLQRLEASRISFDDTGLGVTIAPEAVFLTKSGDVVRRAHAIEHVKERDALRVFVYGDGPPQFFATRHVTIPQGQFVLLSSGTFNKSQLDIIGAYRLYGTSEELDAMQHDPALAFAVLLERYGVRYTVGATRALFEPVILIPQDQWSLVEAGELEIFELLRVDQPEQTHRATQIFLFKPIPQDEPVRLAGLSIISLDAYERDVALRKQS